MKQKNKSRSIKLFDNLHKVRRRHVDRFVHTWLHTHHALIHTWELLVISVIWFSSMLFANYNSSYQHLYRSSSQEITNSLAKSIQQQKPKTNESKVISIREMDWNVNNTFAPGYCTYWAARISPEFFPYSEDNMSQERTRWWNAKDRCENAEKAWFKIWSLPSVWSLIVYDKVWSNTVFWHVGKVMYYNKTYKSLIVRDMNRVWKFVMSDRWENAENENIKCFIYPGRRTDLLQNTNNDEFNVTSWELNNNTTWIIMNPIKTGNTTIITWLYSNNTNIITTWIIINSTKTGNTTAVIPWLNEKKDQPIHESAPTINTNDINNKEPENSVFYERLNIFAEEEKTIEPNINFSDITNHFLSKYETKIVITKKNNLYINEAITLKIIITEKETNKSYEWILPFVFGIITQNNILDWWSKTIQLIHWEENNINFKAIEKWTSSILVTIDDEKIISIPIIVN